MELDNWSRGYLDGLEAARILVVDAMDKGLIRGLIETTKERFAQVGARHGK